jgi:hypothetical protein
LAPKSLRVPPADDPADPTVWPNQTSRANSDEWIVKNHDAVRKMQPRVLVVNFSNEASEGHCKKLIVDLFAALKESSRYHGYSNTNAPAFIDYRLFKFVDLRDPASKKGNCDKVPIKKGMTNGYNIEYQAFFSDNFARYYGVQDAAGRFLRLDELVERGYVHELWMMGEATPGLGAYESVEEKPVYNEQFVRQGNKFVQAGNGGDDDQKWTGRSLRLGFINTSRGIGCFMESLSHSIEGTANSGAIPYFTKYFNEFAGLDLKKRFNLPFESFYPLWGSTNGIEYPDDHTAIAKFEGKTHRIENYLAYGGNVHFPPNARRHYDLENIQPVLSTIEDWRIGSALGGKDLARPWSNEAFAKYRPLAPDCMGPWLIYWRQNFPGLDNKQKDDSGKPMKNWWPFLFY